MPTKPGVYLFKNSAGKVVYIGKAVNLRQRVKSYFQKSAPLGPKTSSLVGQIKKIGHVQVESELEALLLEAALIKKHWPKFNSRSKDDKQPLYIKITKEDLSRVTTARAGDIDEKTICFGPFPKTKTVKEVLRLLRRIFPFCSCKKNQGKPCLYWHLGLCQPSPRLIVRLPKKKALTERKKYQQNIANLTAFLKGKKKSLISRLKREMKRAARKKNFEEAAKIRDQVEALEYITQPFRRISQYLANPNLLADLRQEELKDLNKWLKRYFPKAKGPFRRIEAYDISNIRGTSAAGSMVVFVNGEAQKSAYRRFKIKTKKTPDDLAMIKEVLKRRARHREWDLPDLIFIDGGQTQVKTAQRALEKSHLKMVPIVGLAKRSDSLVVKEEKISCPKNSPATNLLKRIQAEAHRFAIAYHRHLRAKAFL